MKKTILYIAASTIGFVLMLTNCSKKADPAPAATTSTAGTTTTGTTTGSTTTSTTSGSTTSNTSAGGTTSSTTAGSTTSSTTSGSSTSSTTAGTTTSGSTTSTTVDGSGTFTVNGVNNIPTSMSVMRQLTHTITTIGNSNHTIQMVFNGGLTSGNYSISTKMAYPSEGYVNIAVKDEKGDKMYFSEGTTLGTITVSGKTVSFNNITIKQFYGTETINISGDYTFTK